MTNQFRSIVFDFDYTLADSSNGVTECVNYALNSLGLPMVSHDVVCKTIGLSLADTFREVVGPEHAAQTDRFAGLFVQRADRVMTEKTFLYEAVRPTMTQLKRQGMMLGIVSTKYRYRIEDILERDRMLSPFDVIVGGEDVSEPKPDPEGLYRAMQRLETRAHQTLYVGDSLVDAETARRAGVPFAAILSGVTPRCAFEHYGVSTMVDSLHHLSEWLGD